MATEDIFSKLRKLQDVLAKKIELEREIDDIPKNLTTKKELVIRLKEEWIAKDEEYRTAKNDEATLKNSLSLAEGGREKAEKKMDEISTQREYEILDKGIREATASAANLRKEIKQTEQKIKDLDAEMSLKRDFIDQQETELEAEEKRVDAEIAKRKKELKKLETKEKVITEGMDEELLFKFERIVKKKGGNGIVSIKGGVCSSCHMILPSQFANTVRGGKEIVSCPYCSSILFYEEGEDNDNYFDDSTAGSLVDLDDLEEEDFEDEYDEEEKTVGYDDE